MKNAAATADKSAALLAQHIVCSVINDKVFEASRGDFDAAVYEGLRAEQTKALADLETLYEPAPIAAFKSNRSAQIAMTKAENAYNEARNIVNTKRHEGRDRADWETFNAELLVCEDNEQIARCYAFAVYTAARAQEFYVRSYAFNYNATRELIAMNID